MDQSEEEENAQKISNIKSHEQFNVKNFTDEEEDDTSTDDESVGTMSDNENLWCKRIIVVYSRRHHFVRCYRHKL